MKQDLFKYLPSEITINILSRLPVGTIAISKCVCKPWLDLVETDEFVKSHLSRSAAALAFLTRERRSNRCAVFELEDEIDVESSHDHHYIHLTEFNFPLRVTIVGSVNGLLLLHNYMFDSDDLYVCNPISRDYIELHCPFIEPSGIRIYGFGASKITVQHKVVCINYKNDCYVYTLGTCSWRRIEAPCPSFSFNSCFFSGTFVNGNLHRLVKDSKGTLSISCFDLETEYFSTFSVPLLQGIMKCMARLSVLRDCLCFCDGISGEAI